MLKITSQFLFGVIVEKNIHHEGDERSRTHPGHGYPAHTETVNEFIEFKNEDEFRHWIEREESNRYSSKTYRAIAYQPLAIKKTVSFDITS